MKDNDWKDRLNVVYSTNPDFNYEMDDDDDPLIVSPEAATKVTGLMFHVANTSLALITLL